MLHVKTMLIGSLLVLCQLGCGSGPEARLPVPNPPPKTQANISVSPENAIVGSADLIVTITGSETFPLAGGGPRFNKVLWSANGSETELSSTLVSSSQLTAIVPATLLSNSLKALLRVEIWDHIEGTLFRTSSSVPFQVTSTLATSPSISSISPSTVAAAGGDTTITIDGSGFGHYGHFTWSTAFWTANGNLHDTGTSLQTTIISSSQLTAVIPAKLLQSPTSAQIVVMNGDVMGMSDGYFGYPRSNSVTFTVTQ